MVKLVEIKILNFIIIKCPKNHAELIVTYNVQHDKHE